MRRTRWGPDGVVIAGLLVTAVLFWRFRIIAPASIPYDAIANGDFFNQIYPMALRAATWWREGAVPLWNPYQTCGLPFAATGIYGVFYPLNFLYLLAPADLAIELEIIVHLALAGLFMYAYGRSIELDRSSAAMAGGTFMLSGYVAIQATWFPPALAASVWLPLSLVAIERIEKGRRLSAVVLLGFAVAMGFLSGWPQIWFYTVYVIAVYAAVRLLVVARHSIRDAALAGASTVAGLGLGVVLAALQLLPEVELQQLGPRRQGALSPLQLSSLAVMSPSKFLSQAVDSTPGAPRFAYVGMATLVLVSASVSARRLRSRVLCLGFLSLTSVVAAISFSMPYAPLLDLLPGMTWFRAIPRILYVYAFAMAAQAGIGFSALVKPEDSPGSTSWSTSSRYLALSVVVALLPLLLLGSGQLSVRSGVYLELALGLAWLLRRFRAGAAHLAISSGLILLACADLFAATRNPYLHPYHGTQVFHEEDEALDYVRRHQGYDRTYLRGLSGYPSMMDKQGTLKEIYSITDYEPLSLSRYREFFRLMDPPQRIVDTAMTFTGELDTDPTLPGFHLLQLMAVRFIVVKKTDTRYVAALGDSWNLAFPPTTGKYAVYERAPRVPRAQVAGELRFVASGAEAMAAIADPTFDPLRTTVVERHDPGGLQSGSFPGGPGAARIVEYTPARVRVAVDAPHGGMLVLSDTYYPGWEADVDGNAATILRANFLFRGVRVPAGRHRVTFQYRPASFRFGAVLSLVGCSMIALYWVWLRIRLRSGAGTRT